MARPPPARAHSLRATCCLCPRWPRVAQGTGSWLAKACSRSGLEDGARWGRPGTRAAGDPKVAPGPDCPGRRGPSSRLGHAGGSRARRAARVPWTHAPEPPPRAGTRAPALGAGLGAHSVLEVRIRQCCARRRAHLVTLRATARVGGTAHFAGEISKNRESPRPCPHLRRHRTRWDPPNPRSVLGAQVDIGVSFIPTAAPLSLCVKEA